ncbi:hypothetical protein GCM10009733_018050 [Nonomuraea maheshkhaliensis]|uniref:Transposase n=1 Tax=Nonomuraea maheshkhaliensis TaxID=419590 RepID=A0ABP4QUL3_9ACTN
MPVKRGLGQHATETLHPEAAADRLRHGANQAVRLSDSRCLASLSPPLRLEIDLHQPRSADLAAFVHGRTVVFDADTMTAAYGVLQLIVALTQTGP